MIGWKREPFNPKLAFDRTVERYGDVLTRLAGIHRVYCNQCIGECVCTNQIRDRAYWERCTCGEGDCGDCNPPRPPPRVRG